MDILLVYWASSQIHTLQEYIYWMLPTCIHWASNDREHLSVYNLATGLQNIRLVGETSPHINFQVYFYSFDLSFHFRSNCFYALLFGYLSPQFRCLKWNLAISCQTCSVFKVNKFPQSSRLKIQLLLIFCFLHFLYLTIHQIHSLISIIYFYEMSFLPIFIFDFTTITLFTLVLLNSWLDTSSLSCH